ncbi:MAG TPA: amidohydrolase family protein [Bryobacteraceae bacterium]|nr:amidohydrolase family protein [Bryobacteraceae bacterium]
MSVHAQTVKVVAGILLSTGCVFAEVTVLQNFNLIDGRGGTPVPNASLVIRDGRIEYAGPGSRMPKVSGARIVDLTGKYVMPGIINLHGHVGNVSELTQDPKNFTRANVDKNLKTYASYGVTSVVSMGSDQPLILDVRSEQRAGRPATTRVFTAYRGFTGKGGYPTSAPGMKGVPFEVENADQVKKDVAELAAKKVDVVKIWVDDHLGKQKKIPMDLSKAIIEAAHRDHLKVAAHIFYLDDAKQLVEAGLDGLAHSVRDKPVDSALIASMKKHGAWQMAATLAREGSMMVYGKNAPFLDDPFFTRSVSPGVIATLKSSDYQKKITADPDFKLYAGFLETAKKNLKRLADAGVKYGFGTDTGPPARFPGYFEHWEMELMVDAGLTPMQVITAASKSSAEFLGVSKELGTLERGKWADLIVLRADPLANIKNTRTIDTVYIAGNKAN